MSKQKLSRIIQNQFDLILFEEGNFSPLNWMLSEGYLGYKGYQNWRQGKSEYLEDHFKMAITELVTTLERIQDYANFLGLEAIKHNYASTVGQTIYLCRSPQNELIFSTGYEPAQDRMQMDLFFDSAILCTEFNLIGAIIDKRSDDVSELLIKLETTSPEKHQQFLQLLVFEENINHSRKASDIKIKALQTLTPLAFEIFGRFAQDFLSSLWHKLSIEIADQHFNPDAPDYHLSYTAFKGFQWEKVISSIERESGWARQPVLLFRYAEACFKQNKEQFGIANWFKLFIFFPETAEQMIVSTCNRLIFSDWQCFSELDPELELSLFPAWVLMNRPLLAKNSVISDINGNDSLQLIKNLVCNDERKIDEMAIHFRTQLKKSSPDLFVHYMRVNLMDHGP
jgi:hypothetical protein